MWHCSKGCCANIRRRSEAKHCSSLCSQSEGGEYCDNQARAENPTKSYPKALTMFATCSWPSLCKQSELQCWRPILRRKQFVNSCNSLLRRPRPKPSPHLPPQKACNPSLQSPHRESLSLYQVIDLRPRAALPSAASSATFGREPCYLRPRAARLAAANR